MTAAASVRRSTTRLKPRLVPSTFDSCARDASVTAGRGQVQTFAARSGHHHRLIAQSRHLVASNANASADVPKQRKSSSFRMVSTSSADRCGALAWKRAADVLCEVTTPRTSWATGGPPDRLRANIRALIESKAIKPQNSMDDMLHFSSEGNRRLIGNFLVKNRSPIAALSGLHRRAVLVKSRQKPRVPTHL